MENQCIGLAENLGLSYEIKHVEVGAPWKYLPVRYWPNPLSFAKKDTPLSPPWPDVLISCGRRSVATAAAIKKKNGNKTFAIHLQVPHVPLDWFDVVIVPEHDNLNGDNVIIMRGSLHRLTQEKLADAKKDFAEKFEKFKSPKIGVLVGGSNKRQDFTTAEAEILAERLKMAIKNLDGASILMTPSRRTGKENIRILKNALKDVPGFMWMGKGENPYFGIMAHADILVVTSDSVNMVSEACYTGKPVYIYPIPGGSPRLISFNDKLVDDGYAKRLETTLIPFTPPILDEMGRVSNILKEKYDI